MIRVKTEIFRHFMAKGMAGEENSHGICV